MWNWSCCVLLIVEGLQYPTWLFPFLQGSDNYCLRAQRLNFQSATQSCNTLIWTSTAQLTFLWLGLRRGLGYTSEYDLGDHKSSTKAFNFDCLLGEVNYYVHLITKYCASVFIFILLGGYCQRNYCRLLRTLSGPNLPDWESNMLNHPPWHGDWLYTSSYMLPTPGWAGLGPKVVSCVAMCVGNKRAKLIVELDSCGEGAIMFLGTLLERFSWRCMFRGLERQRERKQKENILSDDG